MIHLDLRGTKADLPWSIKPALKSGLDIAPSPKLSPRLAARSAGITNHTSGEVKPQAIQKYDLNLRANGADRFAKWAPPTMPPVPQSSAPMTLPPLRPELLRRANLARPKS
jgi:hypothetical protein